MNEKLDPIRTLENQSHMRAKIARAFKTSIDRIAREHGMGETNAKMAYEAVERALITNTHARTHSELRHLAEDEAARTFEEFGFNSAEVLADLRHTLDASLPESDRI
ncbi:hypothetical protein COU20_03920 [Candidatus Kaiserbacteria bacterium CG10_big_fil_rev_8_21_14_0_10_59_10]|uniref:Uncharacterized protein n=1 Tax=Candidatus Kaiserbacteria bacterium CG10_big_fil_rev_8_21_14_0_10_59_10 TaxID=1974612 RepID=A0A2H0U788_9BACT|nr:MAG: hypothetical protein COU20_03920 [Candidatus Kaiserbacteria bacterium CG10_big_fil_rev_8_21_14_0_10_59_10]